MMGTKLFPCGEAVALTVHLHSAIYCSEYGSLGLENETKHAPIV